MVTFFFFLFSSVIYNEDAKLTLSQIIEQNQKVNFLIMLLYISIIIMLIRALFENKIIKLYTRRIIL